MKTTSLKKSMVMLISLTCTLSFHAYSDPAPKVAKSKTVTSKSLAAMSFKNVEFGFNKITIPEGSYTTLNKVAKLMVENDVALKLGGYADNKGGYVYNWMLSKARAEAVKEYLVKNGANESRIAATEYGYTKPIASNKTSFGRKKNRRVEIKFAE